MKQWFLVVLLSILITGCMTGVPKRSAEISSIEPQAVTASTTETTPDSDQLSQETGVVPTPPKLISIDWSGTFAPLIQTMYSTLKPTDTGTLFIDSVKNNTNGSLQTLPPTAALYDSLNTNPALKVIPFYQAQEAEKSLGLSSNDSLVTLSKAMGVARYLKANYLLFTRLTGNIKQPNIKMQLLSVGTGELIWSGSGTSQLKN